MAIGAVCGGQRVLDGFVIVTGAVVGECFFWSVLVTWIWEFFRVTLFAFTLIFEYFVSDLNHYFVMNCIAFYCLIYM